MDSYANCWVKNIKWPKCFQNGHVHVHMLLKYVTAVIPRKSLIVPVRMKSVCFLMEVQGTIITLKCHIRIGGETRSWKSTNGLIYVDSASVTWDRRTTEQADKQLDKTSDWKSGMLS